MMMVTVMSRGEIHDVENYTGAANLRQAQRQSPARYFGTGNGHDILREANGQQ